MRIISKKTLREFWEKHQDSQNQITAWYHYAKRANWRKSSDIKEQFRNVSIISSNRIVFNICGNKYRLVIKINFEAQLIFIRFIGTHKQYDEIEVKEI